MAMIISRFTVFRQKNAFISLCSRQHVDASRAIERKFLWLYKKKMGKRIHSSVFGEFPIHQYYVHTTEHYVIFLFYKFMKGLKCLFLCLSQHADASRLWNSRLFGLKPQKGLEFKIAVTADIQDLILCT